MVQSLNKVTIYCLCFVQAKLDIKIMHCSVYVLIAFCLKWKNVKKYQMTKMTKLLNKLNMLNMAFYCYMAFYCNCTLFYSTLHRDYNV